MLPFSGPHFASIIGMKPTKHNRACQRVFGRYDKTCPRCLELMQGAPARNGWQTSYFAAKAENERGELVAIKNHDCKKSGCAPVCTFGDW